MHSRFSDRQGRPNLSEAEFNARATITVPRLRPLVGDEPLAPPAASAAGESRIKENPARRSAAHGPTDKSTSAAAGIRERADVRDPLACRGAGQQSARPRSSSPLPHLAANRIRQKEQRRRRLARAYEA